MENANDSVKYSDYCTLRGTAAEGCADRWLAAVRRDSQKRFTAMDPMVRLQAKPQFERWVAGRYQTLLLHEKREVRQGKMLALDNSLAKGAAETSNAIVTDATSEAESIASDRTNAAALLKGEAMANRTAELDRQRQEGNLRRMAQIAAENAEREKLIDDAVEQGLFSSEEGEARKMRTRHDVYGATIKALIDSNNEDNAEAMIDAMQSKPNGGETQTLASVCATSADELTNHRSAIQRVRERKAAEAQRLVAARETAAKEAAREREIKLIQTPMSGNAYADDEQLACGYDELASDMRLPSETRLSYARTAASLRKAIARQKEAEKAERTRQDRAEKRETMREAKEIVANRLERQFRDDLDDFKAGWTYDENGEAVELTVYDMMNRAKTGLDSGRYTVQQFRELMSVSERKWDEESEDLRDHVIAIARQITPYVVYNRQENRFAFRADRKTTSKSSSGIEFGTRGGTQQATYGQLIRALNLTLAAKKNSRMSAADAKRYFDEITAGTVRAQMQATIDENLDYDEQLINAFRSK